MATLSKNVCSLIRKATLSGKRNYMQAQMAPVERASLQERCILIDDSDRVVGEASKGDCHSVGPDGSLLLHRAFSIFLFNGNGDLLLHKRSASKLNFPEFYTNSCCSHPLANIEEERVEENALGIKTAAKRRLNYELGIPTSEVDVSDFVYLSRIHYQAVMEGDQWGEHEIDYILFLRKNNITLDPNPEEISKVEWVSRRNFDAFVQNLNVPLTPWFQLMVEHKLSKWWENLDSLEKVQNHTTIERFL